MQNINRRAFMQRSLALGASGLLAPSLMGISKTQATPRMTKDDISIAQWALVSEVREGKWKTLDFPRIAREDFGINGIEFVNTLFEVPTVNYLNTLKRNADDHGVTMVLIMVDAEGDGASATKKERRQFAINHRKWIDIAQYLGCHSIRTNCRGPENAPREDALKWAVESYNDLLEYAMSAKVGVLIENHGRLSNDADWVVSIMKEVDNLYFGTLPDWREPQPDFDNYAFLEKTLPYAGGMSYRNQPTEELTAKMIRLARNSGYRGWYGIESSGRPAIRKGKELLEKYLFESVTG